MGDSSDREVEILVCSANLGNAQPDEVSWNLWVPDDGRIQPLLQNQQYPIISSNDEPIEKWDKNFSNDSQFDIIVFGLQEATFDAPDLPERSASGNRVISGVAKAVLEPVPGLYDKVSREAGILKGRMDTLTKPMTDPVSKTPKALRKKIDKVKGFTASRDYTKNDKINHSEHHHGGTHILHDMMKRRLPSYEQVVSFQRGEMRLIVWVKGDLDVEVIHVRAQNTGRAGLANKGGIVTELLVGRRTRLAFLTAHLEAHEGKYQARVSTTADILAGTREKYLDCSLTSHYCFVMGDLNFRSEHPDRLEMGEEAHKKLVTTLVQNKDWASLNEIDELNRGLAKQDLLVGYRTLHCNFPPTFKVERLAGYEYIDKRLPSYTDRVLWKANHELQDRIQPFLYEPIDNFSSSDHKPIRAAFSVKLNDPMRLRPKLSRIKSKRLFRSIKKKTKHEVAHKERLHLFVSDISCVVHSKDKKSKWVPNPYVKFTSDPPEVLRQSKKKGWAKVRAAVRQKLFHVRRKTKLTEGGYPRTRVHMDTLNVDFADEEIHAEVKTHGPAGDPYDLSGAMMRVTVMDYRPPDDVVIGTFVFNLANLIRSSQPKADRSIKSPRSSGNSALHKSKRRSFIDIFRRGDSFLDEEVEDTEFNMESVSIDEPILKNGLETGRVKFKIDTWWMDEATAKTVGASLDWRKTIGVSRDSTESETPKMVLSTRHQSSGKGKSFPRRPTPSFDEAERKSSSVQFDLTRDGDGPRAAATVSA